MAAPDTDRLQRQRALFEQALEIEDAAERADFLAQECGDDRELWKELQALLAAEDESPTEFMAPQEIPVEATPPGEAPGDRIGPYTLIDQLGEGGFSVVWRAEQSKPVTREVALKILKPGMDSSEVVTRFEAERQALALMDHPAIAQVYDAGTTERGRPFVVMELVRGVPITDYCHGKKLSIADRLTLFIEVCRAVQHAHQKGVIHRDLKPSNILVVEHEGKPAPKVIDFGIAKAIDQELASRTLATIEGAFLGTPQYMSPEQTGLQGSDIDTRADVYALGAVLYELLTGSTPISLEQLKEGGWGEMERLIREEEPAKPSVRTTTLDSGKTSRHLRGDLDWVVMRALEKERDRRYDTANGFARDLERFLANEPVAAGPPTLGYRTRKFLRRNRTLAASLATIALVLVAAAIISSVLAVRAKKAERDALDAERSARTAEGKANEAKLAEAEKSRALATQLSAAMTERAWQRTADGDSSEALLWHLEATKLAAGTGDGPAEFSELDRMKIGASLASIPPVRWLAFQPSGLHDTAADPHGTWFAAAGQSPNLLTIRDGATGKLLLRQEVPRVNHMQTDGIGKILALSVPKGVLLFRIEALDEPPRLVPHASPYPRMALNADGTLLAIVSMESPLCVYDVATESVLHQLDVPWPGANDPQPARRHGLRCAFSPTDNQIAIAATSGVGKQHSSLTCVDGRSGEVTLSAGPFRGDSQALEFSPDGRFIGKKSGHGGWAGIRFWDLSSTRDLEPLNLGGIERFQIGGNRLICCYNDKIEVRSFPPPCDLLDQTTLPMDFGKDRLVVPSLDGTTFLVGPKHGGTVLSLINWQTKDRAFLAPSKRETKVNKVALSATGQNCSRGDSSGVIRSEHLWVDRPPDIVLWHGIKGHTHPDKAKSARYTNDGSAILGVFGQTGASMWDADTGAVLHQFGTQEDRVQRLALSADSTQVALGFQSSGRISIRSPLDPTHEIRGLNFGGPFNKLVLSDSGRYCLAHGGSGAHYRIWNVQTGDLVAEMPASGLYGDATLLISPDDCFVLGQYFPGDQEVVEHGRFLHRIADGTRLPVVLKGRDGVTTRFSKDGRFVIGRQQVYRIDSAGKMAHHRHLSEGAAPPNFTSLAHDGTRVALVEFDGSVNTWNIERGERAAPTIPADAEAIVAAFSTDDRFLATGTLRGEVRIWEVASGELIAGPLKAGNTRVMNLQFRPKGPPQLLVATATSRLTVWNLSNPLAETASFADLRTAAEILANRRIDERGEVKTLGWSELQGRWKSMNDTVRTLVTRKPVESTNPAE